MSLLEVLLAVAILGVSFSAILTLRQYLTAQAHRLDVREVAISDQRNAMALLSDVNPMISPTGARTLGPGRVVEWRATLLQSAPAAETTALTSGRRPLSAPDGADHAIGLYRLDVRVLDGEKVSASFAMDRLGWARGDRAVDE